KYGFKGAIPELMSSKLLSLWGTREKLFMARCPLLSKNSRNIFLSSFTPYGCMTIILLFRSKSLFYNISQQDIFVKICKADACLSVRSAINVIIYIWIYLCIEKESSS